MCELRPPWRRTWNVGWRAPKDMRADLTLLGPDSTGPHSAMAWYGCAASTCCFSLLAFSRFSQKDRKIGLVLQVHLRVLTYAYYVTCSLRPRPKTSVVLTDLPTTHTYCVAAEQQQSGETKPETFRIGPASLAGNDVSPRPQKKLIRNCM